MNLAQMEGEIADFWEAEKIFEKTLEASKNQPAYVFYDGPPFATGTPHYGHIVGSIIKDVVPRYWTMKGRYVERKWGWDCHGLPIENIAEKALNITHKKEIEEMGVEKFNETCRSKVLSYVAEWKKVMKKLGRWADMENSYRTMDLPYMESVWWVFKKLWEKGLIYEGYRSMHICPRCETTLSQSEVAEGYKDIKDLSAIAEFELVDEPNTFVLAWTTTPWTLLGNVALAVGEDIEYAELNVEFKNSNINKKYIVAKNRISEIINTIGSSVDSNVVNALKSGPTDFFQIEHSNFVRTLKIIKGRDLVGRSYKPLFNFPSYEKLKNKENGWKVYPADFVTTEEGTGIVHIAPAFGEDDLNLGKKNNLPFIQHVGMDGLIKEGCGEFSGLSVKPIEDTQKTDVEIIKYLAKNNLLFKKEKYAHSYPHCWRCETPLLNYATSSWFISVEKIKERALELAKDIDWSPEHIKEGRFGNWLEGARDWSISRQRYWASVIPIWKCDHCETLKIIGSVKELEDLSGQKITDIHKHVVDGVTFACEKCEAGKMKRIPDVLDTWFDSGSMPYAQKHYPFENEEAFKKGFPAEFIAEGVDQTRCWFYYLHLIATAICDSRAFNQVIVNGIVLAEDGKKMSKRLNNYPDPALVMDKYGADALRLYLMSSPVVAAENLNFKESDVSDIARGPLRMLWNSYSFFVLYAEIDKWAPKFGEKSQNLLDQWIISELNVLIMGVNGYMENYELHKAARLFPKFIDNLSNWYIRRSRKRFWKSEDDKDKNNAYETLWLVLTELSKLMAPFTPFISEEIYKNLTQKESVHLEKFPESDKSLIDEKLNLRMESVRNAIKAGLEIRASEKIKVRQPLEYLVTNCEDFKYFEDIFIEELNVGRIDFMEIIEKDKKGVVFRNINIYPEANIIDVTKLIGINTEITEDLKLEGQAREIIRFIQEMRKGAGYDVDNRIKICYNGLLAVWEKFGEEIKHETLAIEAQKGFLEGYDKTEEMKIDGETVTVGIKKI